MGLLQMGLLAWALFMGLMSLIIASVYPLMRERLKTLAPEVRVVLLRTLYVTPVLGGLVATILCFFPTVLGFFFPRMDHCADHADGHAHLCMLHPPQTWGEFDMWFVIGAIGLGYLALASRRLRRFVSSRRLLRQLIATAEYDPRYRAWLVESDFPMALTVGVVQQRTVLSSGLVRAVPSNLIDAIVAHEQAHERRNDARWKALAGFLSLAHVPTTRHALRTDLELACEQACDEEAGSLIGDRVRVAQALIAVERVRRNVPMLGSAVLAFGEHGLDERVRSLLVSPARTAWNRRAVRCFMAIGGSMALALSDSLHHLTETLLGFLLG